MSRNRPLLKRSHAAERRRRMLARRQAKGFSNAIAWGLIGVAFVVAIGVSVGFGPGQPLGNRLAADTRVLSELAQPTALGPTGLELLLLGGAVVIVFAAGLREWMRR